MWCAASVNRRSDHSETGVLNSYGRLACSVTILFTVTRTVVLVRASLMPTTVGVFQSRKVRSLGSKYVYAERTADLWLLVAVTLRLSRS
jgi:hypothetical protein